MAEKKETRQVHVVSTRVDSTQGANTRGVKRPTKPEVSDNAGGKPPGSQSVRRTKS